MTLFPAPLRGALALILLFDAVFVPLSQASLWDDRRAARAPASAARPGALPRFDGDVQGLSVPPAAGVVMERWFPSDPDGKKPLVIHLQDAHGLPSAQRSAAAVLSSLRAQVSPDQPLWVGVEGAWGTVDPSWLDALPAFDRASAADSLLDGALMTGEERVAYDRPADFRLEGVESPALFAAHTAARRIMEKRRRAALARLRALSRETARLKEIHDAPSFHALEAALSKEPFTAAWWSGVSPILSSFPTLSRFRDVSRRQVAIDPAAVDHERREVLRRLAQALPSSSLEVLARKAVDVRSGRLPPDRYDALLAEWAGRHGIGHALLSAQAALSAEARALDLDALARERAAAQDAALAAAARGRPHAAALHQVSRRLRFLKGFWTESMTPEEWALFRGMSADEEDVFSRLRAVPGFSADLSTFSAGAAARDRFIQESYYKLAFKRDDRMAGAALSLAGREKRSAVVLITGGFHTPGITRFLRRRGNPYVVIRPQFSLEPGAAPAPAAALLPAPKALARAARDVAARLRAAGHAARADVLARVRFLTGGRPGEIRALFRGKKADVGFSLNYGAEGRADKSAASFLNALRMAGALRAQSGHMKDDPSASLPAMLDGVVRAAGATPGPLTSVKTGFFRRHRKTLPLLLLSVGLAVAWFHVRAPKNTVLKPVSVAMSLWGFPFRSRRAARLMESLRASEAGKNFEESLSSLKSPGKTLLVLGVEKEGVSLHEDFLRNGVRALAVDPTTPENRRRGILSLGLRDGNPVLPFVDGSLSAAVGAWGPTDLWDADLLAWKVVSGKRGDYFNWLARELYRVLIPGGRAFLQVSAGRTALQGIFEANGFSVQRLGADGFLLTSRKSPDRRLPGQIEWTQFQADFEDPAGRVPVFDPAANRWMEDRLKPNFTELRKLFYDGKVRWSSAHRRVELHPGKPGNNLEALETLITHLRSDAFVRLENSKEDPVPVYWHARVPPLKNGRRVGGTLLGTLPKSVVLGALAEGYLSVNQDGTVILSGMTTEEFKRDLRPTLPPSWSKGSTGGDWTAARQAPDELLEHRWLLDWEKEDGEARREESRLLGVLQKMFWDLRLADNPALKILHIMLEHQKPPSLKPLDEVLSWKTHPDKHMGFLYGRRGRTENGSVLAARNEFISLEFLSFLTARERRGDAQGLVKELVFRGFLERMGAPPPLAARLATSYLRPYKRDPLSKVEQDYFDALRAENQGSLWERSEAFHRRTRWTGGAFDLRAGLFPLNGYLMISDARDVRFVSIKDGRVVMQLVNPSTNDLGRPMVPGADGTFFDSSLMLRVALSPEGTPFLYAGATLSPAFRAFHFPGESSLSAGDLAFRDQAHALLATFPPKVFSLRLGNTARWFSWDSMGRPLSAEREDPGVSRAALVGQDESGRLMFFAGGNVAPESLSAAVEAYNAGARPFSREETLEERETDRLSHRLRTAPWHVTEQRIFFTDQGLHSPWPTDLSFEVSFERQESGRLWRMGAFHAPLGLRPDLREAAESAARRRLSAALERVNVRGYGVWMWLKGLRSDGAVTSLEEYARRTAWRVENLYSGAVGALSAVLAVLAGVDSIEGVFTAFQAATWTAFLLGHVADYFVKGIPRRQVSANLRAAGGLTALMTLPVAALSWAGLPGEWTAALVSLLFAGSFPLHRWMGGLEAEKAGPPLEENRDDAEGRVHRVTGARRALVIGPVGDDRLLEQALAGEGLFRRKNGHAPRLAPGTALVFAGPLLAQNRKPRETLWLLQELSRQARLRGSALVFVGNGRDQGLLNMLGLSPEESPSPAVRREFYRWGGADLLLKLAKGASRASERYVRTLSRRYGINRNEKALEALLRSEDAKALEAAVRRELPILKSLRDRTRAGGWVSLEDGRKILVLAGFPAVQAGSLKDFVERSGSHRSEPLTPAAFRDRMSSLQENDHPSLVVFSRAPEQEQATTLVPWGGAGDAPGLFNLLASPKARLHSLNYLPVLDAGAPAPAVKNVESRANATRRINPWRMRLSEISHAFSTSWARARALARLWRSGGAAPGFAEGTLRVRGLSNGVPDVVILKIHKDVSTESDGFVIPAYSLHHRGDTPESALRRVEQTRERFENAFLPVLREIEETFGKGPLHVKLRVLEKRVRQDIGDARMNAQFLFERNVRLLLSTAKTDLERKTLQDVRRKVHENLAPLHSLRYEGDDDSVVEARKASERRKLSESLSDFESQMDALSSRLRAEADVSEAADAGRAKELRKTAGMYDVSKSIAKNLVDSAKGLVDADAVSAVAGLEKIRAQYYGKFSSSPNPMLKRQAEEIQSAAARLADGLLRRQPRPLPLRPALEWGKVADALARSRRDREIPASPFVRRYHHRLERRVPALLKKGRTAGEALIAATDEFLEDLPVADLAGVVDREESLLLRLVDAEFSQEGDPVDSGEDVVYLTNKDLTAADLSLSNVPKGALLSTKGSKSSHAAIKFAVEGKPAVMGLSGLDANRVNDGDTVVVNGLTGEVIIRPTPAQLAEAEGMRKVFTSLRARAGDILSRGAPKTKDGVPVPLVGNVDLDVDGAFHLEQIKNLQRLGVTSLGLVRTDGLYAESPKEMGLLSAFQSLGRDFPGPVSLRVFDRAKDKALKGLPAPAHDELGSDYILSPEGRPAALTFLRALLMAHREYKNLQVLFPMVGSPERMRELRALVEEAKASLLEGGRAAAEDFKEFKVGGMIEDVAAAENVAAILAEADFLSYGTNDLSMSVTGKDRLTEDTGGDPRVLSYILKGRDALRDWNAAHPEDSKSIKVCGNYAIDFSVAAAFMGTANEDPSAPVAFSVTAAHLPLIAGLLSEMDALEGKVFLDSLVSSPAEEAAKRLKAYQYVGFVRLDPSLSPPASVADDWARDKWGHGTVGYVLFTVAAAPAWELFLKIPGIGLLARPLGLLLAGRGLLPPAFVPDSQPVVPPLVFGLAAAACLAVGLPDWAAVFAALGGGLQFGLAHRGSVEKKLFLAFLGTGFSGIFYGALLTGFPWWGGLLAAVSSHGVYNVLALSLHAVARFLPPGGWRRFLRRIPVASLAAGFRGKPADDSLRFLESFPQRYARTLSRFDKVWSSRRANGEEASELFRGLERHLVSLSRVLARFEVQAVFQERDVSRLQSLALEALDEMGGMSLREISADERPSYLEYFWKLADDSKAICLQLVELSLTRGVALDLAFTAHGAGWEGGHAPLDVASSAFRLREPGKALWAAGAPALRGLMALPAFTDAWELYETLDLTDVALQSLWTSEAAALGADPASPEAPFRVLLRGALALSQGESRDLWRREDLSRLAWGLFLAMEKVRRADPDRDGFWLERLRRRLRESVHDEIRRSLAAVAAARGDGWADVRALLSRSSSPSNDESSSLLAVLEGFSRSLQENLHPVVKNTLYAPDMDGTSFKNDLDAAGGYLNMARQFPDAAAGVWEKVLPPLRRLDERLKIYAQAAAAPGSLVLRVETDSSAPAQQVGLPAELGGPWRHDGTRPLVSLDLSGVPAVEGEGAGRRPAGFWPVLLLSFGLAWGTAQARGPSAIVEEPAAAGTDLPDPLEEIRSSLDMRLLSAAALTAIDADTAAGAPGMPPLVVVDRLSWENPVIQSHLRARAVSDPAFRLGTVGDFEVPGMPVQFRAASAAEAARTVSALQGFAVTVFAAGPDVEVWRSLGDLISLVELKKDIEAGVEKYFLEVVHIASQA